MARNTTTDDSGAGFTDEERAAMKDRAAEVKSSRRKSGPKVDGRTEMLAKIAEMNDSDRALAEQVYEIVTAAAPELEAKTWYGMPAWARDGQVVCFFQNAGKFKARYATLGFNDPAKLDDGTMWPTSYALTEITAEDEKTIAALVTRAVG